MTMTLVRQAARSARTELEVDRAGIRFWNLSPDTVAIEFSVRNDGPERSSPTEAVIQAAPLGAFVEWRLLGREGIDNDGDGRLNEDGPGYLDMNRNYGFKWQPRYVQGGSGDFPMSSRPTKAVSDFIITNAFKDQTQTRVG